MRGLRALAIAMAILPPSTALAEIARIRGGEHVDFTRIVIDASSSDQWTLGRDGQGYALKIEGDVEGFDLSRAFDKIPRSRIRSLLQDEASGTLRMDIGCDCHAVAFEVRPGTIAIDVRNGPAAAGSEFERPFHASERAGSEQPSQIAEMPPLVASKPISLPEEAPVSFGVREPLYNWLEIAGFGPPSHPAASEDAASDDASLLLDPLRDALMRQISQGIAEGVVVPGEPAALPEAAKIPISEAPGFRIVNGEMPGFRAGTGKSPGPNLTAEGKPCLPDRMTDIGSWRPAGSPLSAFSDLRSNLLSEFDEPIVANVLEAARVNIALGFGAEARQVLALLYDEQDVEEATLEELSYLVDLENAPGGVFSGMESCDSYAALWAMLTLALEGADPPATAPNTAAVTRSFSALSQDLRQHLAPVLVSYFMSIKDETTARRLRDAALRAPGAMGQQVQLMDAGMQLATGNAVEAADIAEEVLADPGVSAAKAAILRAESAFEGDRRVPPDLAAQLASLTAELRGTENYLPIRRAEILAHAMSGDFPRAFDLLSEVPDAAGDLWKLAADAAPDDVFLTQALKASEQPPGGRDTNRQVAQRLLDYGFANEALLWLGQDRNMETESDRMLAAQAALAIRDARLAVRHLAGLTGPKADSLRAQAALQLGNAKAAATIFLAGGDERAALRAEFWAGDWSYIAGQDAAGITPAAAILLSSQTDDVGEGILARGARMAGESENARETISGLMQAVPQQFP